MVTFLVSAQTFFFPPIVRDLKDTRKGILKSYIGTTRVCLIFTCSFCRGFSLSPGCLKKEKPLRPQELTASRVQLWRLGCPGWLAVLLVPLLRLNSASTYQSPIIWKLRWLEVGCWDAAENAVASLLGLNGSLRRKRELKTASIWGQVQARLQTSKETYLLSFLLSQGPGVRGQESGSLFIGCSYSQRKFWPSGILEERGLLQAPNELLFVFSPARLAAPGKRGPAPSAEHTLGALLGALHPGAPPRKLPWGSPFSGRR